MMGGSGGWWVVLVMVVGTFTFKFDFCSPSPCRLQSPLRRAVLYLTDDDKATLDDKAPLWMDVAILSRWRLHDYMVPDTEMQRAPIPDAAPAPIDFGDGLILEPWTLKGNSFWKYGDIKHYICEMILKKVLRRFSVGSLELESMTTSVFEIRYSKFLKFVVFIFVVW